MDKDELNAYYLLNKSFGLKLQFEPNGKKTFPDFSADGDIAIEVTRSNKLVSNEPIEKIGNGLVELFKRRLKSIEHEYDYNIHISLHFKRPIANSTELINDLTQKVFDESRIKNFRNTFSFNEQISMTLFPSETRGNKFLLSTWCDKDASCLQVGVQEERDEAIKNAVFKKGLIVKKNPGYKEYWLVIIDYISLRDDYSSFRDLKRNYSNSIFSRIIFTTRNHESLTYIDLKQKSL